MSLKKCPVCKIELFIAERQGVEIDYCKKCGGVWLDKDELENIIDISDKFINENSEDQQSGDQESFFGGFFDFDEKDELD
jgi:Zn-finger nucleic acid-binding protein